MSLNAQRWRWNQKPPLGSQLDPSWVGDFGCVYALAMNEAGGIGGNWYFNDSVQRDGMAYTRNNADTGWGAGDRNSVFFAGANEDFVEMTSPKLTMSQLGLAESSITVIARYANAASNSNLEPTPIDAGTSPYSSRRTSGDAAGIVLYSTPSYVSYGADGNGLFVGAIASVALTAGKFYTIGGSYNRNLSISTYGGTWTLYMQGLLQATNNRVVAGSFGGTFTNNIPQPLCYAQSPTFISGKVIDYLYVFNRDIGPGGHAQMYANPFMGFQPPRYRKVFAANISSAPPTGFNPFAITNSENAGGMWSGSF